MSTDALNEEGLEELQRKLEQAQRQIQGLEALSDVGDLLDASLDFPRLALLALKLSLRVLPADAALLVTAEAMQESAHYLLRGEDSLRSLELNPSRLAREVLETGQGGARREVESPGALAAAEILGEVPALRVAVPLSRLDRTLGVLEVTYRQDPDPEYRENSAALRSVADHLAIALDNARLMREQSRRARELSHICDLGSKINAHLDLDTLLEAIVDSFLELVPADAAGIFLIDRGTHKIRNETLRGYRPEDIDAVHLQIGVGILGAVASTGQAINVPDVSLDPRYVAARRSTRSEMAAPLRYEDQVIGVFNLESDQLAAFGRPEFELMTTFSNHAAISIMNGYLHGQAIEKRRLEEQLGVARRIQEALLPREAPEIPGHALAGKNLPSAAVGGDYFDFLPLSSNRWAIIVADVSGNGIPASLIMAGFRAEVRAELRRSDDPCRVLAQLNRVLHDELDSDHFVTAFLGVYSPESGSLIYSNAGHEPGLIVHQGVLTRRLTEGGLLLGAFPEATYRRSRANLAPGDRLLLYTDGLSDAGDPWGDYLGAEGIVRLLQEAESSGVEVLDLPETILERARRKAAVPSDEADDRTLVVLARQGD